MRLSPFSALRDFFENFYMSPKGPPLIFGYFAKEWLLKNSNGPPFHVFRYYETVQNSHFCLILGFLNTYPPIIFFILFEFFKQAFFGTMRLFSNLFLSQPSSIFLKKVLRSYRTPQGFRHCTSYRRHFWKKFIFLSQCQTSL